MMIKITYAQEHRQNSRQIRGSYFYVRTHYLKEFHFNGEWYLPENATFSVYRAEYHYHPLSTEFWICAVGKQLEKKKIIVFPQGRTASIEGKFKIVAYSNCKTYSPRLIKWWNEGDGSIEYAELCTKYIQSCINQIPQFELDKLSHPKPQPTDAVLGSDAVFQKWLSTAAVLGGKAKNKDFM
jgi:hypothetical protein